MSSRAKDTISDVRRRSEARRNARKFLSSTTTQIESSSGPKLEQTNSGYLVNDVRDDLIAALTEKLDSYILHSQIEHDDSNQIILALREENDTLKTENHSLKSANKALEKRLKSSSLGCVATDVQQQSSNRVPVDLQTYDLILRGLACREQEKSKKPVTPSLQQQQQQQQDMNTAERLACEKEQKIASLEAAFLLSIEEEKQHRMYETPINDRHGRMNGVRSNTARAFFGETPKPSIVVDQESKERQRQMEERAKAKEQQIASLEAAFIERIEEEKQHRMHQDQTSSRNEFGNFRNTEESVTDRESKERQFQLEARVREKEDRIACLEAALMDKLGQSSSDVPYQHQTSSFGHGSAGKHPTMRHDDNRVRIRQIELEARTNEAQRIARLERESRISSMERAVVDVRNERKASPPQQYGSIRNKRTVQKQNMDSLDQAFAEVSIDQQQFHNEMIGTPTHYRPTTSRSSSRDSSSSDNSILDSPPRERSHRPRTNSREDSSPEERRMEIMASLDHVWRQNQFTSRHRVHNDGRSFPPEISVPHGTRNSTNMSYSSSSQSSSNSQSRPQYSLHHH